MPGEGAPVGVDDLHPDVAARVARLHASQPLRVWSLIITVFGDMVAPRGGEIWAGTLSELLAGMRIDATAVRAALSRLARDGWLDRVKVGRLSYYRLSQEGRAAFGPALARVYRRRRETGDPALRLLILPEGDDRVTLREEGLKAGYGTLGPSVLLGTAASPALEGAGAGEVIRLGAEVLEGSPADLVARGFDLAPLAQRYRAFLAAHADLDAALEAGAALGDLDAAIARTLLIHDYRRLILRDPMLPAALLDPDWPGAAAADLTARLYARLRPGAERWIAAHARCRAGELPEPDPEERRRFSN